MSLQIGIARADITPPIGIPMVGFAGRDEADAVHDPLTATALVASHGDTRAVLICTDLLFIQAETVAVYRQLISAITDIPPENVTLSCAHNHYGPDVDRAADRPIVAAYRDHLGHQLAGLVYAAVQQQRTARFATVWGESDIGINRREKLPDGRIILGHNPEGAIDRRVGLTRLDGEDGKPLATLVNFACHPVCQGGKMRALSADYPGRMRHVVESLTGAPCLFLQGAGANINPIYMEHTYETARTLGTRLGCEAVRLWETAEPREQSGLEVLSRTCELPGYRYGSREEAARLVESLEEEVARRKAESDASGPLWWAERRLERVRQGLHSWETDEPMPTISAELQAWKLGDLALATAPGEIFNEIGAAVKGASPFPDTFFASYINGSIGYVPVPAAYAEGGYEVTHACRVDPEAGAMIENGCLQLLQSLKD